MEVGSVSSSLGSAPSGNTQVRPRQTEPQPQQTQQAQGSQSSQENEAADRARAEAARSQPSVNTSGQVVGTRVNTTA